MMEFLEPSLHHFQQLEQHIHHHDGLASYSDAQGLHSYAMAAQHSAMMGMPPSAAKSNETKPRLGKEEVEILEKEFKKNPKPTTQTKRQFADEMGVDLARINNWFQNRRAKRKQEKKQEAYEAGQAQEASAYSEPSSPDYLVGSSTFYNDTTLLGTAPFMMGGPPPAVAPCNPQYSDPSTASMESLHRTVAAVQAASRQQESYGTFLDQNEAYPTFGGSLMLQACSNGDRAQFPPALSAEPSMIQYDASETFSYGSNVPSLYSISNPSIPELNESPVITNTPTPFQYTGLPTSQLMTAFPSQLLPAQSHDGLPSLSHDGGESQSPEGSEPSTVDIGFKYDIPESDGSDASPPAPTVPFKAPTPMDIASRRKKVHVKPAALTADTMRGRPSMGPRTVSHADGFRRPSDSPIGSPMRRIASAGGNRNILAGRINKSGIESAQRSPINLGGFAEAGAFLEHNYHNIRQPSLATAGSSLNNSLAPPTPLSPRGGLEMILVKRDHSRSDTSSNFVYNGLTGGFCTMEGDQNLASPPETPQNSLPILPLGNGWPTGIEFGDKPWSYDVPDEPLFTPAQDSFQGLELHMPQPSYLSSLSQPVTPAFGHFNPNVIFAHESPQFNLSNSEYAFPESNPHFMGGVATNSPMTKQKTFQFSHSTPADFTEK